MSHLLAKYTDIKIIRQLPSQNFPIGRPYEGIFDIGIEPF